MKDGCSNQDMSNIHVNPSKIPVETLKGVTQADQKNPSLYGIVSNWTVYKLSLVILNPKWLLSCGYT